MKKKLTPKQELFCQEYMKDMNATRACIRAGYSKKTADRIGPELLGKTWVAERVNQLKAKQVKRIQIDADEVLLEIKRLAMADMTQAFDDAGFMKPLSEIPEDVRRSMASLEVSEIFAGMGEQRSIIGHMKKPRFHDKTKALDMLMKHLGEYKPEKHEHSGPDGKPIEHKNVSDMPEDQLDARIKRLMEKQTKGG